MLIAVIGTFPAPADAASLGKRPLQQGMRGHDVRVLQDFLTRLGLPTTVDGQYGRGTERQVRRWERASELRVDGRMSRADVRRMRRQVESGTRLQRSAPAAEVAPPPTEKAVIGPDGQAIAPASAPEAVKQIIAAGNRIHDKPYRYGGGHASFRDTGYDCSGSISYALHGAGLLERPLDSSGFRSWAERGRGQWVTVYTHSGHAFLVVAGLRFDTSGRARTGSRWQTEMRSTAGYAARHPAGL